MMQPRVNDQGAVIHKYKLPFKYRLLDTVEVPVRHGQLLHLAIQHGAIHVWAVVDPRTSEAPTVFHCAGTGVEIDTSWHHLGTVIDGDYVWHVFSESRRLGTRDA